MTTTSRRANTCGWRVYAIGVMMIAALCLAWGVFDQGQPVPKGFPGYTTLAYAAAVFMLIAAAAILWHRSAAWGSAALAGYYALFVVIGMNGSVLVAHPDTYGSYEGIAVQIAITAGALIIFATHARIDPAVATRLVRAGQVMFGASAVLFGGAHFVYLGLTAPLVPKWLPPSQVFWAYATGVGHIAAGVAILTGVRARLAAILLTAMYASFTPLVHVPMLLGDPSKHFFWAENAANIALVGVAWVVADSCVETGRHRGGSKAGPVTTM